MDYEKIAGDLFAEVRGYVERSVRSLADRIAAIEARQPARGEKGETGERGPAGERGAEGAPGRDGRDGQPGIPGRDGEKGVPGTDGRDGIDGKDGRDGADGLGFDDLSVEQDSDGRVTLRFVRGERVKEFALRFPVFIDRGVYREGESYERGNGTTFGGSYWLAQKDGALGKPGQSDDWRLAVKKGRDGRDGEKGERGVQGEKGLPGINGRDLR